MICIPTSKNIQNVCLSHRESRVKIILKIHLVPAHSRHNALCSGTYAVADGAAFINAECHLQLNV